MTLNAAYVISHEFMSVLIYDSDVDLLLKVVVSKN